MSILLPISHCRHFVALKLGHVSLPALFFFSKLVLAILGPLTFCMNFRISLSISAKAFDRDYIESVDQYGD